ncbi:hypothetical protein LZ554_001239 [Drepanopeziza brunnea f. sp. 'monogermtubi']|nr:hypothetical protein LZ554_001239 [Drepanopeziza brunnea f. sp. 'monogermtubi']
MGSIRQPKDNYKKTRRKKKRRKKTRRGRPRSSEAAKYTDPETCNRPSLQNPSPQWESITAVQIDDQPDGPIKARKPPSKKTPSAAHLVSRPPYNQDGLTNYNDLYYAALEPSIPRASFLCRRCNGPVSALTYVCLDDWDCGADNTHIFNRKTNYNSLSLAALEPLIPRASFPCRWCNGPVSALTYVCLDDWHCGRDHTHIVKWVQLVQEAHLHLHDGNGNDNDNDKDLQEYRKQACVPVPKSLLDVAGGNAAAAGRPRRRRARHKHPGRWYW